MAPQEIDYDVVEKKCVGVLKRSFHNLIQSFRKSKNKDRRLPLHILAQKVLVKYKARPECTAKEKEFRDKIIHYYKNK